MKSAYETIRDTYDIETLREIYDHGCQSGVAHDHIYYAETVKFFDEHEEEITEYIDFNFGNEVLTDLFTQNEANITCYKNDVVWCYVEMIAGQLIDEYENTTQEELSDSDEIEFDFSSKGDTLTAKPLNATTYDAVKELASTPWGKDHLEIVSA